MNVRFAKTWLLNRAQRVGVGRQIGRVICVMVALSGHGPATFLAAAAASTVENSIEAQIVQARPDLGILKNVLVLQQGAALKVSGEILVSGPRRSRAVRMQPAKIKIEVIDATGHVVTTKSRSLDPHGLHIEGGRRPTFDFEWDLTIQDTQRLRVSLEQDDAR